MLVVGAVVLRIGQRQFGRVHVVMPANLKFHQIANGLVRVPASVLADDPPRIAKSEGHSDTRDGFAALSG